MFQLPVFHILIEYLHRFPRVVLLQRKPPYIIPVQILQHIRYGLALLCLPLCQLSQLPVFHIFIEYLHRFPRFILLQRKPPYIVPVQILQHPLYGFTLLCLPLCQLFQLPVFHILIEYLHRFPRVVLLQRKPPYIIPVQILQHIRYGLALLCLPLCQLSQLPVFHIFIEYLHRFPRFILLQRKPPYIVPVQILQHPLYGFTLLCLPLCQLFQLPVFHVLIERFHRVSRFILPQCKFPHIISLQVLQYIRYGLSLLRFPACQLLQLPVFHVLIELAHRLSLLILLHREFSDKVILKVVQHVRYGLSPFQPPLCHLPHCLIVQIREKNRNIISVFQQHAVGKLLQLIRLQYGNGGFQLLPGYLIVLHIFLDAVRHGGMQELRLSVQNLVHSTAKQLRQLGQLGDIRHAVAPLPVGDGLKTHVQLVGKLCLRHVLRFSQGKDLFSHLFHIKHTFVLSLHFLKKLFLKRL